MTDNEILKALKFCPKNNLNGECPQCTYFKLDGMCFCILMGDSLDLINRQKAEIEVLIAGQESLQKNLAKTIKSEAVREYREKVAIKLAQNARSDYWHWIDDTLYEVEKEMVGEG